MNAQTTKAKAKGIPVDKLVHENPTDRVPRTGLKRMSTDMTRAQHLKFLIEAESRGMTMREYFFHCWETTLRVESGESAKLMGKQNKQQKGSTADALRRNKERIAAEEFKLPEPETVE